MVQWGPFVVLVVVLTVVLLVLARHSQQLIFDQARADSPGDDPRRATDSELAAESIPSSAQSADDQAIELSTTTLLVNVASTQGIVIAIIAGAAWYFSIPAVAFGVTTDAISAGPTGLLVGIGFGIVLWLGSEFATGVADAVGTTYDERVREMLAPETTGGWLILFGIVLPLIATGEELLFRAALIGAPAAGLDISPWLLAIASSAAFALGHGAQGRVGVVVTGLLGFGLAGGFILTGSLLVVVVAHYVVNALEFYVHEYLALETPIWGSALHRFG